MPQDPRSTLISQAISPESWDVIVIGGGATGLSTAWDAASRGYRTALIESHDFSSATSSRSTKLVHGGVRYLQQGELSLVREALQERSLLLRNASEFCRPMRFAMPCHAPLARYYYRIGMWLYDALAGDQGIEPSELLSPKALMEHLPAYHRPGLQGGIAYTDGQFDDAELAIAFAQCINHTGNLAINYVKADKLIIKGGQARGVIARDMESLEAWEMKAKVVINATGIFADQLRKENKTWIHWRMRTSRGSHIVCPGNALGSDKALIIPKTQDGRVLFAIPWKDHTLIGTTDVPTEEPVQDPHPSQQEIDFIVEEAQRAFEFDPSTITSSWAGLRPLVSRAEVKKTSKLSRKHIIDVAPNGLISILGGKWTTCRRMAQDTIDEAIRLHQLSPKACRTHHLILTEHGATPPLSALDEMPDESQMTSLVQTAIQHSYARTPEDILARRLRLSFLDQKKAESWIPLVQTLIRRS
ncbi:glycerol-3-phosphate dehydrogenase [Rubritalea squalenifaciens DSM 18772]|uniref:Glycerol-3-phosphate dehydrogenase n=1 Tax=Rubritalea squalenifaciens DSM 18772 TaxID=1123071 RepID=A0A1M6KT01_9BACT|nr:glycerol-3-phosphate dehydrogenase/oxidase [Rubritalea squalenifaciens]SHJ62081.1 glycerol-3-phosphate dehydrogenase [Rubritalea squalenifaciens DSM 18772]